VSSFEQGFIRPQKTSGKSPNRGNSDIQSLLNNNVQIPFGFYTGGGSVLRPLLTAGDTLFYSGDDGGSAIHYTSSTTDAKVREISISLAGTVRVSMRLKSNNSLGVAYGRIYKNGVAVGTQRSVSGTTPTTFTEDIAVSVGDLIQVYCRSNNASYLAMQDLLSLGANQSIYTVNM
jgi:hypothetical protein